MTADVDDRDRMLAHMASVLDEHPATRERDVPPLTHCTEVVLYRAAR